MKTMKNKRIRIALTAVIAALFASAFVGCDVHTTEELEIRRCPQIRDTVLLPGWEIMEP